ncbi:peptidoglycan DD-metalloendopeptidase family protein [Deinococcus arenicola]|uniref:Peptidoglycan DD-metalloendopeptidase family protein n=1 Tax=Deinococcus arenicola TaxID=2994950 RepID=A0ABU4DNK1_9DEIO|nr:peptidoglycan DD-metalloendopeptidase family protein [Deinococcus sp. ZS9-10]MDV6374019.1 peptidoglycan DD-metalloendopeptidase family protein [Deinococcus sp. ZS9-10]
MIFPSSLHWRTRVLTALFAASLPMAHASLPGPLAELLAPSLELLRPEAESAVALNPDPAGPALHVVTDGQTTAQTLAQRYGVTPGAVQTLQSAPGWRLTQIQLPGPAVQRAPARPASIQSYAVRSGDTLSGVAAQHGLSLVDLLSVNLDRQSLDALLVGESLNIPGRERGLLVRIKPGQSALSLIEGYGADLVATARANDILPTELHVGDELLLPGIQAEGFRQKLLAAREADRLAQLAYERQQKYEQYLGWKAERDRQRLEEKYARQQKYDDYLVWKKDRDRQRLEEEYARQEQYDAYLAWKNSPERQQQIAAYERQTQYEAAQAAARRQEAQAVRVSSVVQTASASHAGGLSWPLRSFTLTSRFGERDIEAHREVFHGGIDLAAPFGTPIYAASSGTVTASDHGAFGLNVYTVSGTSTVIYGHMSRTAVVPGQSVQPGQVLGYVGCTGICTGPHLHFEVRLGGQQVDPIALLP